MSAPPTATTAGHAHPPAPTLTHMGTGRSGGGTNGYGYDPTGNIIEAEAAIIRDVAHRLLAGSTFSAEARRLNDAGIGGPGARWYPATVSRIVLHPRVAGERAAVRGATPRAILDRDTFDALVAAADERHRTASGRPPNSVAGLLAGIAHCGRCGAPYRLAGPRDNRVYRCPAGRRLGAGRVACGRTQVAEHGLDDYVTERALDAWAAEAAPYRAAGPPAVAGYDAEILDLVTAAGHLEEQYHAGLLHAEEYQRLRERFTGRLTEIRARRQRAAAAGLPDVDGDAIRSWWQTATLAQRHALVGSVYPIVRVKPATRPGPGRGTRIIDPGRIVLESAPVAAAVPA